jgi:hypothetical protein
VLAASISRCWVTTLTEVIVSVLYWPSRAKLESANRLSARCRDRFKLFCWSLRREKTAILHQKANALLQSKPGFSRPWDHAEWGPTGPSDSEELERYTRLRDARITLANRREFLVSLNASNRLWNPV